MTRKMWMVVMVLMLVVGLEAGAAECRGGQIGVAPAPYAGTGFELQQRNPQFRAAHAGLRGQPVWVRDWTGPLSAVRRFQAPGGTYLLVDACMPHDCGDNLFYGAWVPPSGAYGALVYRQGTWVEAGRLDDGMRAALLCAIEADRVAAAQVRAYLQAHPFKTPWER